MKELSNIGFEAMEEWTVEDFYTFFHQLNILYNRLAVLDDLSASGRTVKLKSALYGSLSRVKPEDRLKVESIEIHSPGDFNLLGVDKIIGQLRALLKDLLYRNRQEREQMEESLRHRRAINSLNERAAQQKLLSNQIRIMKELGYQPEQIEAGAKAFLDPLQQVQEIGIRKQVSLKPGDRNH